MSHRCTFYRSPGSAIKFLQGLLLYFRICCLRVNSRHGRSCSGQWRVRKGPFLRGPCLRVLALLDSSAHSTQSHEVCLPNSWNESSGPTCFFFQHLAQVAYRPNISWETHGLTFTHKPLHGEMQTMQAGLIPSNGHYVGWQDRAAV